MTVTIDLSPNLEARLNALAQREQIEPAEALKKLAEVFLPPVLPPEEQARREQVLNELAKETERLSLYAQT